MHIIFETERLFIRRLTMDDFEDFYLFNSNEDVMRYIRKPQTREQTQKFLQDNINYYNEFPQYGRWALIDKSTQKFTGSFMVRPSAHVPEVEIGYALMPHAWGNGLATEALQGGMKYAFEELKLPCLIAITYPQNILSQKVLLKCGFVFEREFYEEGQLLHLFKLNSDGY
jgi:ribosomal-protein-alanine N-acetyltransferase